ncbi:chemotaxis protein CheB [Gillisia limnaea]|uniref:MCP methyltransferase/methylesterase, CheR/CheB with PAS/PAC sensor n=1 Tax=Gillisia limnaea (strain DSM 15749 / LMG 21470 / R-8282) TaxID=865937 RepID=H2BW74_GILLR|nr:chemotaxis protein CheB [Gillisia limnaea]EHQ04038.1 MCP methyltransferase/methylesterase, CheR/CheB with PAS/PAC sensor [Gillisia limnaea DSM 15749]
MEKKKEKALKRPKDKKNPTKSPKPSQKGLNKFPIVGIGASAGGLEALELFFGNLRVECDMAFVVVQHLNPDRKGMMPELLQRITPLKVYQATDWLKVEANSIYVIPPNKSLSIEDGILHLSNPVEKRGLRLPIDFFFRSLAEDRQEKSIGVILSGMGSDGSLGVKAIKEKSGLVLVQDPETAKFDNMPLSAMKAVQADIVAPAEELPKKLIDFNNRVPADEELDQTNGIDRKNLDKIIFLLQQQSGHDFSHYKENTLFRRIDRRKGIHRLDRIDAYIRLLEENPEELDILFKELLIGVTSFFRDEPVWEKLKTMVLPELMKGASKDQVLRAWVPACSTGEEAYSLAILFTEAMEKLRKHKNLVLQIFATDINQEAIEKARKGFFSPNVSADVSPQRLKKFFKSETDGYQINPAIRDMVVFAPQNVIKDPPFTKLDLLLCRNMLIYMEPELQEKLIVLFNYSLKTDGVMILGTSETLGKHTDSFKELDSKLKIYQRTSTNSIRALVNFPSAFFRKKILISEKKKSPEVIENIQTLTDQVLLQRYAPASVLVNAKGDILYITGRTGNYLEPVAGKANWNIFAMARESLRFELPAAFQKASKNYEPLKLNHIRIETNNKILYVNLLVQRLDNPAALKDMIILVFTDVIEEIEKKDTKPLPIKGASGSGEEQNEFEMELQRSYEEIKNIREQMQISQEELQSTNEELQSTNEELQSTNEELTTSKEEMQSMNEELQTVNIELRSKVRDYVQADSDMKNLLNSTQIATLFLDKDLNIRRYTKEVTSLFKLRKTDIGRSFTDLVSDLEYPEIKGDAQKVLGTLIFVEKAIQTKDGRWFNVRIMPYRTNDDRIDGLVITFTNITKAKKLEIELKEANDELRKSKIS